MLRQIKEDKLYTPYTIEYFKTDIEQMKQEMLEQLYNELHHQEQEYMEPTNLENKVLVKTENNQEMINQVIEQSQELEIGSDEINTANMELNQAEQNYILEPQMQENIDMGIGIGE